MKIVLNAQKVYSLTLAYMLSFLAFLNLGNELFNLLGIRTQLDTVLLYGLLLGLVVLGFVLSILESQYVKIDLLAVLLFFAVSYLLSLFLFPANGSFLFTEWADYAKNPLYVLFLYCLPGYVFARRLHDYESFCRIMRPFSYAVVILSIIVFFFAKGSAASQYMTFSYNMLTQLFFLMIDKPRKGKVLHYIFVGIGLTVFLLGGARGATIFLLITGVLWYLLTNKATLRNVIGGSVLVIIGTVIAFFKNGIFLLISGFLESLSIDSRTFELLLSGELLNDQRREILYRTTFENLGVFGKGMMGDRVILDTYPHNLFLELMLDFGWLIGAVLILLLCYCLGRALIRKHHPEFLFVMLLLPCGFLKLMVTGSYLGQEPAFYILFGFCVNSILRSKQYANTHHQHGIRSGQYGETGQADCGGD